MSSILRHSPRLDQRGAALALATLCLLCICMAAALAVDVGMLTTARTEAQRSADTAAHAGASALIFHPGGEGEARDEAIRFAWKNVILGDSTLLRPEHVEVILDESKVISDKNILLISLLDWQKL